MSTRFDAVTLKLGREEGPPGFVHGKILPDLGGVE
jgi:hypothetical protein